MIRQDNISIGFSVLAVSLLIFLGTFGAALMLRGLFSVALILSGLVLSRVTGRHDVDVDIEGREWSKLGVWIAGSLAVIFLTASLAPKMGMIDVKSLSGEQIWLVPRMFGVLIAVAEEQFFRGFMANLFISRVGVGLAVPLSGLFFAVYHAAVYGTSPNLLLFVAVSGMVLTYAAVKTGRVSTPMIAHVVNNFMSGV